MDTFLLDDFNPHAIARKIAKRMRKKRLSLNISQQALSIKSGVSLGSLKRFENSYEISLKHLLQLALALDSLADFQKVFSENDYQSIDDILIMNKTKERERGRNT